MIGSTLPNPQLPYTARLVEMQSVQVDVRDFIDIPTDGRHLLHKRIFAEDIDHHAKPSVRLYFILKLYQFITQQKSFEQALQKEIAKKIGIVGEYCITLMYLDNHFQDEKYGVKKNDPISCLKNREERARTQADLDRYIQTQFSGKIQELIIQAVEKLFRFYHKGMELDKTALTLENFLQDNPNELHRINPEIDVFVNIEAYLEVFRTYKSKKHPQLLQENYFSLLLTRAHLINTVFFQIFAELLIEIFGSKNQNYGTLIEYARIFGMSQQLVNDNCDYLPISYGYTTLCKLPEDTFSDMRRRLLTLPMMEFFSRAATHKSDLFEHYASDFFSQAYGTFDNMNQDQKWYLTQLKESKALGFSMGKICTLAKYGESLFQDPILKDMFSSVRGNRFYKAYKEFEY